jgi:hypothetical protein
MTPDEVVASLERTVLDFNFARPGPSGTLGEAVVELVVKRIVDRSEDEKDAEGAPWPANDPRYTERKQRAGGSPKINRKTGQMLSPESLRGTRTTVTKAVVTMIYGTNSPPGAGSAADRRVTDVSKAGFAHDAGREFYALGPGDPEAIAELMARSLSDHLLSSEFGRLF